MAKYDFSGWATRTNIKCSDGRTIRKDAFKDNDGQEVPLVWNHQHNEVSNVLGHALLENRDEGVYAYCTFNNSVPGQQAKELVMHGDITALSIYANKLKHVGHDVVHGAIREVSLVLAGANPGAFIDTVLAHSDEDTEDAVIYTGEKLELYHSEEKSDEEIEEDTEEAEIKHSDEEKEPEVAEKEKTVQDVFNELTEEQKTVVYAIIGQALEDAGIAGGEGENMKHNVFDDDEEYGEDFLTHADMEMIISDAKRCGSMKEAFLAHAEANGVASENYGIANIDYLFPEAKNMNVPPEFIKHTPDDWVSIVMNGVHHTPFSRIKSMFADITEDEARAKGYIKGKLKKEEVFSLLKRSTTPTTIYKKQKMDRDDIVDITDFDVIAWLKAEMRVMLDEEIARAILIGDGRLNSSDDKINEQNIRPIVNDDALFTIRWAVAAGANADEKAKNFIKAAIKARKNYKGSGQPIMFTTEDMLTDMLLLEDGIGHRLYKTESELATALRVSRIVPVSAMEGLKDKDSKNVYAIIVNLNDYNVGADKGGAVNMFDDFDIDYNQQKYLIETRCSGALVKPFSAIVLRAGDNTQSEEPTLSEAMSKFKSGAAAAAASINEA